MAVGAIAGYIGAMTGLGGAVVIMPALSILLGVPVEYAVGASLVATIATSSGAAATYVKDRLTNIKIGMSLEIGTTIGAIIGALLAAVVYSHNLSYLILVIFGSTLLLSLYPTLRRRRGLRRDKPDKSTRIFQLEGRYHDNATGREVKYIGVRWWFGEAVMFCAGIMSGLLGIGSGVLKVLGMDSGMHLPFKVSTATSDFMIGVTAVTGSTIYWALGYIRPMLVAPIIIGVIAGSYAGGRKIEKTRGERMRILFAVLLVIIAVETILRGFGLV